jgi:pyruvate,water dikinase
MASWLLGHAARLVRDNEVGKATFLMTIDGARAAARSHGRFLAGRAVLDDDEDVFSLTLAELTNDVPTNARQLVAFRQERGAAYLSMRLPETWVGQPELLSAEQGQFVPRDLVRGLGVSPGRVEGTARVVTEPFAAEPLSPDEILVAAVTDPSWTPIFGLVAGLVIDIGGPASHGAIVARELGVPCVINTGDGTRAIATGDRVVVDGAEGTVRIMRGAVR